MSAFPSVLPLALLLPAKAMNFAYGIIGIGALIFLHELGHFLVARWMGMPVETFSLGFGPRLLGFKWRETDVRLSALPLGGYVKLEGFNPEEPGAEDPHGFLQQPYWKRMLFYSGGILANLVVAFTLFTWFGQREARITQSRDIVVAEVQDGAAKQAGLQTGDELLAVGPYALTPKDMLEGDRWNKEIVPFIQSRPGQVVTLHIAHEGRAQDLAVTPANVNGVGRLGLAPGMRRDVLSRRAFRLSDVRLGAGFAAQRMVDFSGLVFGFLKKLLTFKASRGEVGGPIAITQQMSEAASLGIDTFLFFCAAISLQLAILNALPIPMLDGGHMAVLSVERLRRRDFSLDFKEKLFTGGFLLLASLMAIVIFLDVLKLRH